MMQGPKHFIELNVLSLDPTGRAGQVIVMLSLKDRYLCHHFKSIFIIIHITQECASHSSPQYGTYVIRSSTNAGQ